MEYIDLWDDNTRATTDYLTKDVSATKAMGMQRKTNPYDGSQVIGTSEGKPTMAVK